MKYSLTLLCLFALLSACAGNNASATPASPASGTLLPEEKVSFSVASRIVQERCLMCHQGANPRGGVSFASPEEIKKYADRIRARAVTTQSMPPANQTGMTENERKQLGNWIAQGAALE